MTAEAAADIQNFADAIDYFETHDIGDELETMPAVPFQINLPPRKAYYSIDRSLSDKVRQIARQRGVSAETLVNLWVQEKASETPAISATK